VSGTRAVFVAGAGTEIGKTYVTAALTRRLRALGRGVRTLKPLASGVPPLDAADFAESDTGRLLAAQGLATTPETVAACSPWRFTAPLSPDLAATREGRTLALDDLVGWCRREIAATPPDTTLLIEGVGGVMSPPTPPDFVAGAIARHRAVPVIVIARNGDCPVDLADLVRPASAA
jgi:dethiobiotin synthetase